MNALLRAWTAIDFENPECFFLLLLLPLLWARWRRGTEPALLSGPGFPDDGTPVRSRELRAGRTRFLLMPRILDGVALVLLVAAIARPVTRERLPVSGEGIDLVLVMDLSSSMKETDLDARRSRLEVARAAAVAFVDERKNDRIALIGFARYPELLCPLTLDHATVLAILKETALVKGEGREDATGIGTAMTLAARVLSESPARSKVAILLTDGEENVATAETQDEIAPLHAGQLLKELGVRVHAIVAGLGARGPGGAFVKLDPRAVRGLAERTGGTAFEVRDAESLSRVYREIDQLERAPFERPKEKLTERFLGFLAGTLVLLLLARVLDHSVLEVLP